MTTNGKNSLCAWSFSAAVLLAVCCAAPGSADAAATVSGGGHFNLPLDGCDIGTWKKCFISAYFDQNGGSGTKKDWNCGTKTYSGHKGTDFTGSGIRGRSVVAAGDGVVDSTNDGCYDQNTSTGDTCGGGYGNYVKITHKDTGLSVVYAHMMKGSIAVSKGQSVKCGDALGKVASSGSSTGAHLHFDVRPQGGNSASRFDPYLGSCNPSVSQSQWKVQNAYQQVPADDQCAPLPVNDSLLISETTADGTEVLPGEAFTKSWTVKNTGNTTWTAGEGYALISVGGTQLSQETSLSMGAGESTAPDAVKTWTLSMTAPTAPGSYTHNWRMAQNGTQFGAGFTASIVVPVRNDAQLVSETIPAGTAVRPGETFIKAWTVKNTGNVEWNPLTGHHLARTGGEAMAARTPALLAEGETVAVSAAKTWSVEMTAPTAPGRWTASWQMEQAGVGTFGQMLSVDITVADEAGEESDAGSIGAPDANGPSQNTDGGFHGGPGEQQAGSDENVFVLQSGSCQGAPASPMALPAFLVPLLLPLLRRRDG